MSALFPGVSPDEMAAKKYTAEQQKENHAAQKFDADVNKIARHFAWSKYLRQAFVSFSATNIGTFIIATMLWALAESYDSDNKIYGQKLGTIQALPYREMVREYVYPTYVSSHAKYIVANSGRIINRNENHYKYFMFLGMVLGMIIGGAGAMPTYYTAKDVSEKTARTMLNIRRGKTPDDLTEPQILGTRKLIRRMARRDKTYFDKIIAHDPVVADIPTSLATIILDAYLRQHPNEWSRVVAAFDPASIPDALRKKYAGKQR